MTCRIASGEARLLPPMRRATCHQSFGGYCRRRTRSSAERRIAPSHSHIDIFSAREQPADGTLASQISPTTRCDVQLALDGFRICR